MMTGSSFGGVHVRQDWTMVNHVEDWSGVRSPSRAARRRKLGHRQNIKMLYVPKPDVYFIGNMMIGHPETIDKVMAAARVSDENPKGENAERSRGEALPARCHNVTDALSPSLSPKEQKGE